MPDGSDRPYALVPLSGLGLRVKGAGLGTEANAGSARGCRACTPAGRVFTPPGSFPPSPSDGTDLGLASVASALLGYWTNILATGVELKGQRPEQGAWHQVASLNFDEVPHVPTALGAVVWRGHGGEAGRCWLVALRCLWVSAPVLGGIVGNKLAST